MNLFWSFLTRWRHVTLCIRHLEPLRRDWRLLLLMACAVCSGCASGVHNAATLPAEYRIPLAARSSKLDLSRLSTTQVNSSVIGAGDVLNVMVVSGYEEESPQPLPVRVSEAGVIQLPHVGAVYVADLEPGQAEQAIARQAIERDVFRRPNVTVTIEEKYKNRVTVVGAVETQGVVELERGSSDLLGALAAAGGLTETSGTDIQIMRKAHPDEAIRAAQEGGAPLVQQASYAPQAPAARVSQHVDLVAAAQGLAVADYRLDDGDVVMVHEQEPRYVYVMGLVFQPQQVEIPPGDDLRVLAAIAYAGGRKFEMADKVHVIRQVPGVPQPVVIEISIREAQKNGLSNLVLGANDVVSVEETPATFVLGMMQQLLRFGVSGSVPLF